MRRLLVFAAVVCALHAEAERVLDDISSSSVIDPIEMYRNERKNGNKAKALFLALTVLKRLQRNRLDDLDHQNNAGNSDRFGLEWNKRMGTTGKITNGKQEADGIKINFRQVGEERKPQDDLTDWMMRMASKSIDESDSRSVETVKHTKGLGLQKDDDLKFTAVDFKDNFSDWPATFKSSEEKVDKKVKTHEQTKVISDAALRSLVFKGQKSRRPSFSSKEDRWINPRYKSPAAKMPKFTPRALERKFKEGREHCDVSSDSSSSLEKSDSRFSKWDRLLAALDRSDSSSSSSDRRSSSSDSRSSSSSDSSSSSSDKRSSYLDRRTSFLDRSCSCRDKRISSSESSSSSSDSSFSSLDRDSSSSDSSSSSSDSDSSSSSSDSSSSSLISVRSMSSKSLSRFFDSDSFDSSEPSMSFWPSGSSSISSESSSRSHSKTKKKPLCSFCQKMFRKKKGPKKSSKNSSGSSSSSSSGKSILKHYPFLRKLF